MLLPRAQGLPGALLDLGWDGRGQGGHRALGRLGVSPPSMKSVVHIALDHSGDSTGAV